MTIGIRRRESRVSNLPRKRRGNTLKHGWEASGQMKKEQQPAEAMDDGAADDTAASTEGGAALRLLFARNKPWAPNSVALSIPGGRAGTVLVMSLGKAQTGR